MIDIRRIDVIKNVFQNLSKNRREIRKKSDNNDGDDWLMSYLGYDYSLGEKMKNDLTNLILCFETHRCAIKENDRLAAFFAIICAGDLAQKLADIFGGIEEAIDKVLYKDTRFSWPSVPEGYQMPRQLLVAGRDTLNCISNLGIAANSDVLMLWKNTAGEIEVVEKDAIDMIRKTFIELAESIGVSREEMDNEMDENDRFEWRIDYSYSLGERLEKYLDELLLFVDVHQLAVQKNDQLAAYIALMDAGICAQIVSDFFLKIKDEIDKVTVLDKRFSWPVLPDGYQLPEHFLTNQQRLKA